MFFTLMKIFIHQVNIVEQYIVQIKIQIQIKSKQKQLQSGQKTLEAQLKFGHTLSLFTYVNNVRVMVIVWRLRGNIIRTALLDCVTQCSQSAAHLCEQFLQVQQIGFVTLGPLHCVA